MPYNIEVTNSDGVTFDFSLDLFPRYNILTSSQFETTSFDNATQFLYLGDVSNNIITVPPNNANDLLNGNAVILNNKAYYTVWNSDNGFGGKLLEYNPATNVHTIAAPLFNNAISLSDPYLYNNEIFSCTSNYTWATSSDTVILKWNGTNSWIKITDIPNINNYAYNLGILQVAGINNDLYFAPIFWDGSSPDVTTPELWKITVSGTELTQVISATNTSAQIFQLIYYNGSLYGYGNGLYKWTPGDADWQPLVNPSDNWGFNNKLFVLQDQIYVYNGPSLFKWDGNVSGTMIKQTITNMGNDYAWIHPLVILNGSVYVTDGGNFTTDLNKKLVKWTPGDSDWHVIFTQFIITSETHSMGTLFIYNDIIYGISIPGSYHTAQMWKVDKSIKSRQLIFKDTIRNKISKMNYNKSNINI
jgi:hypothetical protein